MVAKWNAGFRKASENSFEIKREHRFTFFRFACTDNARLIETFSGLSCFRWIPEMSGHRYANNSIYPAAAWTAGLALNKFTLGKWLRRVAIIDHLILEAPRARTSFEEQVNRGMYPPITVCVYLLDLNVCVYLLDLNMCVCVRLWLKARSKAVLMSKVFEAVCLG